MSGPGHCGMVVVDKPAGMTSHDVVAVLRRRFGQRRVGHAGTLDPGATGVLIVGLGPATRLLRYLSELPKSYRAQVVLGTETSTLDDEGQVTATFEMDSPSAAALAEAAASLTGPIAQIPPMVSAVKVGGKRLHELARAGVEVERAPRPVTVHRLAVAPTGEVGILDLEVDCSAGTYVRVLAADLGRALGGGAHLRRLRRSAIGPFTEHRAIPLDAVGPDHILTPAQALGHMTTLRLDAAAAQRVAHGGKFEASDSLAMGPGPWAVTDPAGRLLAVYIRHPDGRLKPEVVLAE